MHEKRFAAGRDTGPGPYPVAVPFTFVPHQAPVLPLSIRWPGRFDGVALVAGSVAPDLMYVTNGWGYGPVGIPLWFSGHRWQNILVVALLGAGLAWLVRRVVLPVVPRCLPDLPPFHVRDYAAVAARRHPWWVTLSSALLGAATHLALDAITHQDGRPVIWLQVALSLVCAVVAVGSMHRMGARRHLLGTPAVPAPSGVPGRVRAVVLIAVVLGTAAGGFYGLSRVGEHRVAENVVTVGPAVPFIAGCWAAFAVLVVGCVAAGRLLRAPAPV